MKTKILSVTVELKIYIEHSAPSPRELLSVAKLREFIKTYKIDLTIPPSCLSATHRLTCRFGRCFCIKCRGLHRRPAPFTQGRLNMRLCEYFNIIPINKQKAVLEHRFYLNFNFIIKNYNIKITFCREFLC